MFLLVCFANPPSRREAAPGEAEQALLKLSPRSGESHPTQESSSSAGFKRRSWVSRPSPLALRHTSRRDTIPRRSPTPSEKLRRRRRLQGFRRISVRGQAGDPHNLMSGNALGMWRSTALGHSNIKGQHGGMETAEAPDAPRSRGRRLREEVRDRPIGRAQPT